MAKEQLSREEAIQILTMQRDLMADILDVVEYPIKERIMAVLEETGDKVGYAPAFRCLVKGLTPEESIRWGK